MLFLLRLKEARVGVWQRAELGRPQMLLSARSRVSSLDSPCSVSGCSCSVMEPDHSLLWPCTVSCRRFFSPTKAESGSSLSLQNWRLSCCSWGSVPRWSGLSSDSYRYTSEHCRDSEAAL